MYVGKLGGYLQDKVVNILPYKGKVKSRMKYLLRLAAGRLVVAEGGGVNSTGVREPDPPIFLCNPAFTISFAACSSTPVWQF